ncbi:MAG: Coenzyme F420 hydrogenase/dehydrogenase, beta subunit C-terminal domain [Lachnospiraceae bacterium]|nr:Coenzyme F420 hydrogenase/dehydrogenase, beta subunit C-terminal domain [Lachnospiraceae bacterium]
MYNKDKSVGIVGYWFATNYGGVASYYSLYRKIEQLGYMPFLVETPYLETDKEGVDTFSRNFYKSINARVTGCYKVDELHELNDYANTFVLGSDQVLTSSSIRAFGKLFLMEFANKDKKKIAVSASCGGDNLNADASIVDYAKKLLWKFSSVSVREYSAVDIIKNKFGIFADVIIDPIFLTSKEQYKELAAPAENEEPYLLAYILDPTPDKKEAINKIASKLNLKIKIALDGRKYTYEKNYEAMGMKEDTLPELDFREWIYYLSNASYVFTDSFHGASMGLIMNKPFIMYANYMRGYPRFLTLGKMFDVMNRLVGNSKSITDELIEEEINYDYINRLISEQNTKAEKWLIEALNKDMEPKEPYYAIESYKNKNIEEYDVCRKDLCTGCAACMNICPVNCIEMKEDAEGFAYPVIDRNKCINCNLCKKVCPVLNRKKDDTKKPDSVWAGYSLNDEVRYMSTSGGAFTEFAKYALKMSGVCYGAAYDEAHNVHHVRIDSEEQIPIIRQSKYLQSNIKDTYKNVKRDLERDLYVMFCGTPCQCSGLKAFLGKEYNKLIVVDFICHSICSPKAYQYYLKDIEEQFDAPISRVWFKNKESTWKNFSLRIDFKDKQEYYRRSCKLDPYFEAFLKYRVCSRPSCHNCQFKGADRAADITLADFWGLKWKNETLGEEDMKNGVSLIILNSPKGRYVFDMYTKYHMYTEEHSLEDAIKGNGGYINSQKPGLYRDYFFEHLDKIPFHQIIENLELNEENKNKN